MIMSVLIIYKCGSAYQTNKLNKWCCIRWKGTEYEHNVPFFVCLFECKINNYE